MKKLALFAALLCGLSLAARAQTTFEAELDPLQEVPPVSTPGYGSADFTLSGTTLTVTEGSYADLLGNSSAVTINDAAVGSNGPVVISLTLDSPGTTAGTFSGSGGLTAGQITDLDSGNFYVNVRDNVYPSGEIRGQLSAIPEPSAWALAGFGVVMIAGMRLRGRRRAVRPWL